MTNVDNCIFVNYDVYSFKTPIIRYKNGEIVDTREVESNISTMADIIAIMAFNENTYNVILSCPDGFFNEISDVIAKAESNMYATRKIKVINI